MPGKYAVFVLVGLVLLAVAVAPFLVAPALVVVASIVALRLRSAHPSFSRAWSSAALAAALITAAVGARIFFDSRAAALTLMALGLLAYAGAVVLFASAWSRGREHPVASSVSVFAFGLAGLLCPVSLASLGRGIALADQGRSSWLVDALLVGSVAGIPATVVTGLTALPIARRYRRALFPERPSQVS